VPKAKIDRHPLPAREGKERIKDFQEVALGFDQEAAQQEAGRCLQCKNPKCEEGCPVNVSIRDFVALIEEGEFEAAAQKILETNSLPRICGRVCPQEKQCESTCILGKKGEPVAIGALERFASEFIKKEPERAEPNGRSVAIVGCGPAGLTAAGDLAKLGYRVTIFEALHDTAGVLRYGIPQFRLPKEIVDIEVDYVRALGVDIQCNVVVGRTLTIDDLFDRGYDAVFVGTGAGLPKFMNIPGENLIGVYSSNEFLTRVNLMKGYRFPEWHTPITRGRQVAVVGGGNTAMDSARCALRLGADKVYIVYRRSEAEMPARLDEVHHAREEGIIFKLLCNPVEVHGDDRGRVRAMTCIEMELGPEDDSGRRRPVPKPGSEFTIEVDTVIMAIGQSPNPIVARTTPGLDSQSWGGIIVDGETCESSRPMVFAGGDAVTGGETVISAMGAGKRAAAAIHAKLAGKKD